MSKFEKSQKIYSDGEKYLFEATHYATPIIDYGKGSVVWDVDGNKYYDLNAGQFCMCFGHAYEPFIECVNKQLRKIYHTNTATLSPEIFEAAEKMASITDYKLTKTIFLSTGSEANECALRYAKFITERNGVLSFEQGYHGLTLASQSSTMGGVWARPQVNMTYSVKTPDYVHSDKLKNEDIFLDECIESLRKTFKEVGCNLAAVIIEPVIGVGGMITVPSKYMEELRKLCDEYNVILIFDECQCGFGRSGKWFAYQKTNVVPDILVTAKSMGMGLAVSAVTFKESLAKKIEGKITHFSSHQNDPLSAKVVAFVIDEIKNNNLLDSNEKKGKYLLEMLERVCEKVDTLCNPRGNGLMCAFDIDDNKVDDFRAYSNKFIKNMEENGVLIQAIRQGRTFRIMPNYYVYDEEINYLEEAIINSINNI